MRMRTILLVGLATVTVLLSISVASAAASAPTLGVRGHFPASSGFGQVKPSRVDYGGDPTSFVSGVKWQSWGGARAVGHGKALWVWPGWCVACGGVSLPATVVAFGRTTCQGHSAYAYVEWFFPSRGMSFNRRLAIRNICTGASPPIGSEKLVNCGQVSLSSGGAVVAQAKSIDTLDSPLNCAATRQFVAGSGAAQYLNRNARFTVDGWWCGSELSMDFGGVQGFSCERGDFANVTFELKRA
jgi:hypothetical protein